MKANKMKGLACGVFVALAVSGTTMPLPANAQGIPVIDVSSIIQQIQQVQHMVTQIETLRSQLDQAKAQYEALTGGRGFESLARGTDYNQIPTSWQETLAMMDGGGNISGLARSIRDQASLIDTGLLDQVDAITRGMHDSNFDSAASHLANAGEAYDSAATRFTRLQQLMDAIPQAQDMKGIADLQTRIQAEQLMLQNQHIQLQAMAQAADAQRAIEDHQAAELGVRKPVGPIQFNSVIRSR